MRTKTCCFTGHRDIATKDIARIEKKLEETIISLYTQGVVYYGAGGALGFDTIAAETVLRLRKSHPVLRLILVLPCLNQTRGWAAKDVARYEEIKCQADKVRYISKEYTPDCMFRRNRHLVNYSSICICFQKWECGGTAYTVRYAKSQGVKVINIA